MKRVTWREYDEMDKIGRPAQARVYGVLRGGFVLGGVFYAMGAGAIAISDNIENVTELHYHAVAA